MTFCRLICVTSLVPWGCGVALALASEACAAHTPPPSATSDPVPASSTSSDPASGSSSVAHPAPASSAPPGAAARRLRLYYPEQSAPHNDCVAHAWVERTLPPDADPLEAALKLLFAGPTPAEQARGLFSMFTGQSPAHTPAPPLSQSYRGVRLLDDGTAVVDFTREALPILNAAVCAQVAAKSSIERTLLQFHGVRAVAYSIDGEIVDEWDA